jgi:hypothetical protein
MLRNLELRSAVDLQIIVSLLEGGNNHEGGLWVYPIRSRANRRKYRNRKTSL